MTRFALALPLFLLGCGGSSPPAESAPQPPAPAAADPAPSPAPAASSPAAGDGWEGEGEAKGTAPASDPKPAAGGSSQPADTRTVEVITKLIKDRRPAVRECYDKARKELPSLQGDMVIHIVLDPAGKAKVVDLNQERSTLKSPAVVDCAIDVIKHIDFPPSSRGLETVVNYPFNFMPGGPPQR